MDLSEEPSLSYLSFNEDSSALVVGTKTGYQLFSIKSVDKMDLIHEQNTEDIFAIEWPFADSNMVGIVYKSRQRHFCVCDYSKHNEKFYNKVRPILSVKINREVIALCQEDRICLHDISDMNLLSSIDTATNESGLFALCENVQISFVAYQASAPGEVQIFDGKRLEAKLKIKAHDGPLVAFVFNSTGDKLATASDKGTVIRIFNTEDGSKFGEYRRGLAQSVQISSLNFSRDSSFLCATSNSATVHVFKLELNTENGNGFWDYVSTVKNWFQFPLFNPILNPARAFATAQLPLAGVRSISKLVSIGNYLYVYVAAANGYLYVYSVNTNIGGSCVLRHPHKFYDVMDESCEQVCTF